MSNAAKQAFLVALGAYKYVYLEGTTPADIRKDDYDMVCKEFCSCLLTDEEFIMPS